MGEAPPGILNPTSVTHTLSEPGITPHADLESSRQRERTIELVPHQEKWKPGKAETEHCADSGQAGTASISVGSKACCARELQVREKQTDTEGVAKRITSLHAAKKSQENLGPGHSACCLLPAACSNPSKDPCCQASRKPRSCQVDIKAHAKDTPREAAVRHVLGASPECLGLSAQLRLDSSCLLVRMGEAAADGSRAGVPARPVREGLRSRPPSLAWPGSCCCTCLSISHPGAQPAAPQDL